MTKDPSERNVVLHLAEPPAGAFFAAGFAAPPAAAPLVASAGSRSMRGSPAPPRLPSSCMLSAMISVV